MFQRTSSKPTASHRSDRICHAAIDLHIDDQALPLAWLVDAKEMTAQNCHPYTQDLAWAGTTPVHCNSIGK
jgi:hypothetical protein